MFDTGSNEEQVVTTPTTKSAKKPCFSSYYSQC